MSEIYTRDYGRGRRVTTGYNPPPGYVGTAFDNSGMKMHEADVEISSLERDRSPRGEIFIEDDYGRDGIEAAEERREGVAERCDVVETVEDISHRDSRKLEALIKSLRGKFGTEELILILILLIVSSDGIGIETLMLGLLLMIK